MGQGVAVRIPYYGPEQELIVQLRLQGNRQLHLLFAHRQLCKKGKVLVQLVHTERLPPKEDGEEEDMRAEKQAWVID